MSNWIVSKTDIDALVSVALRWTEEGLMGAQPTSVAAVLTVIPENASRVGRMLWTANHDTFNFGGPRASQSPEHLAELPPERIWPVPEYEFEAFPGMPRPEIALHLASYYTYQTENGSWDRDGWLHGVPPFEMVFVQSMVWLAGGLLGVPRPPEPSHWDPFETDIQDAFLDDPVIDACPWGIKDGEGRDLFVRLAPL